MHFEPKIEMRSYISAVNNGLAEQKKNFFLMFFFLIAIRSVLQLEAKGSVARQVGNSAVHEE